MKKLICLCLTFVILVATTPKPLAVSAERLNDNARGSTFDYPLYGDPNWMSDADFLGLWNERTGEWQKKPELNYDGFPALSPVESAVKAGDYEKAKYELLEYYRDLKPQRNVLPVSVTNPDLVAARLLGENFFFVQYNGKIVDVFDLENDWQEISIDVADSIKAAQGKEQLRTFMINSVSRASVAEFMTKEGGFTPILRVSVNGGVREFPAVRDTYIAAGVLADTNFGREPLMLAGESGTVFNHDEQTLRPYVTFDISSLREGDMVSAATLILKGRNASGTGTKEMVLYQYNDSNWEENTLVWNTFSEHYTFSLNDQDSWDYVTSADTSVKGKFCFLHRGDVLTIPAALWDATKEEEYAYTFLRQIMALVNFVGVNPDVMNHLDMSTHLNATSRNVMQTIDSAYMSPEIFTALLKHLYLMAKRKVEVDYGTQDNNTGSFATSGVYAALSRFRELSAYERWIPITQAENDRLMENFALNDGTPVEASSGYTNTLMGTLYTPMEVQRVTENPDSPFGAYGISQIKKMVKAFAYLMAPGFKSFNWGDETTYTTTSVISNSKNWYKTIMADCPELEYFATGGASGSAPRFTSIALPDGLRTVMRTDWKENAIALSINARGAGSHKHYDQLSVAMFGYGKFLITDQGYGAVLTGDIRRYMMNSQNHSMVVMNDKSLSAQSIDGKCLGSELNTLFDFASYSTPLAPDALTQERSVLFDRSRSLFIVSDYIRPKNAAADNAYVQYWNMLPGANMTVEQGTGVLRSHFEDVNVSVTPVAPETFTAARLEDAVFSPGAGSFYSAAKGAYHKSAAGDVTYDALIIPENIGERFTAQPRAVPTGLPEGAASAFYFDLYDEKNGDVSRAYYSHLNDLSKRGEISVGKYQTDATTFYGTENTEGKLESVFLMNATYLRDSTLTDQYVFKSTRELPAVSFRVNGQSYEILSSALDSGDLEDMTFYNYGKITRAKINGTAKTPKRADGGYLYFGAAPIIEGTASPEPPAVSQGKQKDSAHASGGKGGGAASALPPTSAPLVEPGIPADIAGELENHWAKREISELYQSGIIQGDPGLRLSDNITRAEFTALIVRALNLKAPIGAENIFSDVSPGDWYGEYTAAAYNSGIIEGADGLFRPGDTISREEMCKILLSAYALKNGEPPRDAQTSLFTDDAEISEWAKPYVYQAEAAGLVKGMEGALFKPHDASLREQAFVVLWRLLNL